MTPAMLSQHSGSPYEHSPTYRTATGTADAAAGRRKAFLALLAAILVWGSTFIVTKLVLAEIGPFALTFLRFSIGLLALYPFARRQGFRLDLALQPAFLRFGLTGIALFYALQNLGLMFTSAGNAALIEASIPAVAALASHVALKEPLGRLRLGGIALTILGVVLVSGARPAGRGASTLIGNLLVFGAALSFAIYAVQGKRLVLSHPPAVTTAASFAAGLLFLLPLAAGELYLGGAPRPSASGWAITLYLAIGASALTLFLWNYALQHIDASAAALYTSLVPVAGVGFALLLGESTAPLQLAGGSLAIAGVYVGNLPERASAEHRARRD